MRHSRRLLPASLVLAIVLLMGVASAASARTKTITVKDWEYGAVADRTGGALTGAKPESKLWFADEKWWSVMVPPGGGAYHFYTLNAAGNRWQDQGRGGDSWQYTKPDVLFDARADKLYIASRDSSPMKQNRLYRYSFREDSFKLDSGFPVNISGGGEETLTIAKDSRGKLWIAYTVGKKVRVNRSTTSDRTWGTPFTLPVAGASNVKDDDIAAVQAFGGKIGVFWSNQRNQKDYFAYHSPSSPDTKGWKVEVAYSGTNAADDHINMKTAPDGTVWAAVKTSKNDLPNSGRQPLVVLLHRHPGGSWTSAVVWKSADDATRPICLIDAQHGKIYVLAQVLASGSPGGIYYKSASLRHITFRGGLGTALIAGSGKPDNVTSTKQNLSTKTGLVALASTSSTNYYWHAKLTLG